MDDIRRRRINEQGEWEYECSSCEDWFLKTKFKGCVEKIDAYGNCLMCRSCIAHKANKNRVFNEKEVVDEILIILGYDPYSNIPVYKQTEQRYKEKYGRYFNNDNI